jgi:predicted DNA-binding WGR domain protein
MTLRICSYEHAENVDPEQGHNKYYRIYRLDSWTVYQYGSIKTGAATYKVNRFHNGAAAEANARKQMESKLRGGYTSVGTTQFEIMVEDFEAALAKGGDKQAGQYLQQMAIRGSSPQGKATPPPQQSEPTRPKHTDDRVSALADRAVAAITLAATDREAGLQEYAVLQAEVATLEAELGKATTYLLTLEQMLAVNNQPA